MNTREQRAKDLNDLGFTYSDTFSEYQLRLGCTTVSISIEILSVEESEWNYTIQSIKYAIKHHETLSEKKPVKASPDVYATLPGMSTKEKRELLTDFANFLWSKQPIYIKNTHIDEFLNRK